MNVICCNPSFYGNGFFLDQVRAMIGFQLSWELHDQQMFAYHTCFACVFLVLVVVGVV